MSINQKRLMTFAVICLTGLFGFVSQAAELAANDYHTLINLWYENEKPILTTNYHTGNRIPAGSLVTNLRSEGEKILFSYNGASHVLTRVSKFTLVDMAAVMKRTFGKTNPLTTPAYTALPKSQQEAISRGTVEVGMSKDAVLMSQGYPPEHRTSSIQQNDWTYWQNRFKTYMVYFTDNKVSEIKR